MIIREGCKSRQLMKLNKCEWSRKEKSMVWVKGYVIRLLKNCISNWHIGQLLFLLFYSYGNKLQSKKHWREGKTPVVVVCEVNLRPGHSSQFIELDGPIGPFQGHYSMILWFIGSVHSYVCVLLVQHWCTQKPEQWGKKEKVVHNTLGARLAVA